jgi:hypothetical protein
LSSGCDRVAALDHIGFRQPGVRCTTTVPLVFSICKASFFTARLFKMSLLSSIASYDDVTLILLSGLILTVTAGVVSRSEPLAHPLVLGQQSEPSKVRRPTESAVYRNYGVGMYMPVSRLLRVDCM